MAECSKIKTKILAVFFARMPILLYHFYAKKSIYSVFFETTWIVQEVMSRFSSATSPSSSFPL